MRTWALPRKINHVCVFVRHYTRIVPLKKPTVKLALAREGPLHRFDLGYGKTSCTVTERPE
jgi:hypothetical protein